MGAEADLHGALMDRVATLEILTLLVTEDGTFLTTEAGALIATDPAADIPKAWPAVPFSATAGDYIRVSHVRADPSRPRLDGKEPMDRFGFVALDLFTAIDGRHQIEVDAIADQIVGHFPRDLRLSRGVASVHIVRAWARTGRPDPNGTHWHTPVVVDYRASA